MKFQTREMMSVGDRIGSVMIDRMRQQTSVKILDLTAIRSSAAISRYRHTAANRAR